MALGQAVRGLLPMAHCRSPVLPLLSLLPGAPRPIDAPPVGAGEDGMNGSSIRHFEAVRVPNGGRSSRPGRD